MHQQLMASKASNKVIARYELQAHEGYHKVKCISKSSGIEITEARGDEDVFPEFLLVKGVRLVGGV